MPNTRGAAPGNRINMVELLSRVDGDRGLLHDLLAIFKEDFPGHRKSLKDAIARQDLKQVKAVSHTLKGMLLNLAIARAAGCAARLENLANSGATTAQWNEALAAFEQEMESLLPEMETCMAEAQS